MKCYICPRKCGAERNKERGFCGCTDKISVNKAFPHFWEEPCISGTNGSGAIFFEGCQLHCIFCQNHQISFGEKNLPSFPEKSNPQTNVDLKSIFYTLRDKGVHNINLVTPDAHIPKIIPIIKGVKKDGFSLPFIMNCSGYETEEMIKSLDNTIDIYMPDFKYMSPLLAKKYSSAIDYPNIAKKVIDTMVKQQPNCVFDENGILKRGVIVRHLVMPNNVHDSKKILHYLHSNYGDSIYISIMSQYTPVKNFSYRELNRKITEEEYNELIDYALSIGIKNSYIQEREAANETFIPDFSENSTI